MKGCLIVKFMLPAKRVGDGVPPKLSKIRTFTFISSAVANNRTWNVTFRTLF